MALLVSMHRSKSHFKIFLKHGRALKNCFKSRSWFGARYRCHTDYRRLHKFPEPYYPLTYTYKIGKNSTGVPGITQVLEKNISLLVRKLSVFLVGPVISTCLLLILKKSQSKTEYDPSTQILQPSLISTELDRFIHELNFDLNM